jgi:hypothetical protein
MKNIGFLMIALFLLFLPSKSKAQSAVYFCPQTSQWGYSYGGGNIRNTEMDAYNRCRSAGGTNPMRIISTRGKGFGTIVTGEDMRGGFKMGTSAGARTQQDATDAAMRSCREQGGIRKLEIKATWYDRP